MQFLRPAELKAGFWAIEAQRLVPELIDFGQGWVHSGLKLHPHIHRHWELYFQVEGETEWAIMGQKMFTLRSGCLHPSSPVSTSSGTRHRYPGTSLGFHSNRTSWSSNRRGDICSIQGLLVEQPDSEARARTLPKWDPDGVEQARRRN